MIILSAALLSSCGSQDEPNAFGFTPATNVQTNQYVYSEVITINAPNANDVFSVRISQDSTPSTSYYSINGQPWTQSGGSIRVGDKVQVCHMASDMPSDAPGTVNRAATVTTTLTIQSTAGRFQSTTEAVPTVYSANNNTAYGYNWYHLPSCPFVRYTSSTSSSLVIPKDQLISTTFNYNNGTPWLLWILTPFAGKVPCPVCTPPGWRNSMGYNTTTATIPPPPIPPTTTAPNTTQPNTTSSTTTN